MSAEKLPPDASDCQKATRRAAVTAAALELAAGKTIKVAAATATVSERTLARWLKSAAFRRRVDEIRARLVSEATGHLAKHMSAASEAIVKLLRSRDASIRLRAATKVLELTMRLREQVELEARIRELEEMCADPLTGKRAKPCDTD